MKRSGPFPDLSNWANAFLNSTIEYRDVGTSWRLKKSLAEWTDHTRPHLRPSNSRIWAGEGATVEICIRFRAKPMRCKSLKVSTASLTFSRFAKGSPIPMKTTFRTLGKPSSFARRRPCTTWAIISSASRFRRRPMCPVRQKRQPWAQPTCDEIQIVVHIVLVLLVFVFSHVLDAFEIVLDLALDVAISDISVFSVTSVATLAPPSSSYDLGGISTDSTDRPSWRRRRNLVVELVELEPVTSAPSATWITWITWSCFVLVCTSTSSFTAFTSFTSSSNCFNSNASQTLTASVFRASAKISSKRHNAFSASRCFSFNATVATLAPLATPLTFALAASENSKGEIPALKDDQKTVPRKSLDSLGAFDFFDFDSQSSDSCWRVSWAIPARAVLWEGLHKQKVTPATSPLKTL